MAKDPAFLFYYQDFLVGTDHMTLAQVGAYIKCLCHQANRGTIRESHMKNICETYENHMCIIEKFTKDSSDNYFNERLRHEMEKRKKYTESRRNNRKSPNKRKNESHMKNICETYVQHMENENIDADENENTSLGKEKSQLNNKIKGNAHISNKFEEIWAKYPNKSGKVASLRHFRATVKCDADFEKINTALTHYLRSKRVRNGFVQNGSTWFNNWNDWVTYTEDVCDKCNGTGKFLSSTGYEMVCPCPDGKKHKIGGNNG